MRTREHVLDGQGPPTGLSTMSWSLPDATNYHRWILDLVMPQVSGPTIEVGFGYGQYTAELLKHAESLVAIDCDSSCLSNTMDLQKKVDFRIADLSSTGFAEEIGEGVFEIGVCLNVLEHIEDDRAALKRLFRILRPGRPLLLLVPAFTMLFGPMDSLAGHFRRYERKKLGQKMLEC